MSAHCILWWRKQTWEPPQGNYGFSKWVAQGQRRRRSAPSTPMHCFTLPPCHTKPHFRAMQWQGRWAKTTCLFKRQATSLPAPLPSRIIPRTLPKRTHKMVGLWLTQGKGMFVSFPWDCIAAASALKILIGLGTTFPSMTLKEGQSPTSKEILSHAWCGSTFVFCWLAKRRASSPSLQPAFKTMFKTSQRKAAFLPLVLLKR